MNKKIGWLYRTVRFITSVAAKVCFRVTVEGKENYPKEGQFLLLSNHQSYFDPVLCTLSTRRELCFMARDTLFKNKLFGKLITSLNAIPLKRDESDVTAMRAVLEKLKAGYGICLYPEGTRTLDGHIAEVKAGFSLLSRRGNAPVVPVVIDGMFEAWPKHKKFPRLGERIRIRIGKPITPEQIKELGDRDFSKHLTNIMRKMQSDMRPLSYRDKLDYPQKQENR